MNGTFLVITTIAGHDNPVLMQYSHEAALHKIPFIIIGDVKSPAEFNLTGADYYSVERQKTMNLKLSALLPFNHYSRKNLGYLIAISNGAGKIIETDDDNIPMPGFWTNRKQNTDAHLLVNQNWVNIYRYFTTINIWPRGFSLENIHDDLPDLKKQRYIDCPVQQGLADENPDVDAIYRLTHPLPVTFEQSDSIALGKNSVCPFNSQNTTWFRDAFKLMYLPSGCSFRMTDIWRSFVAQRILWTCGWSTLFHSSTVRQIRNDHNLMKDFSDEIPGYNNNVKIYSLLKKLKLKEGAENIGENMIACYSSLIDAGFFDRNELILLNVWLADFESVTNN